MHDCVASCINIWDEEHAASSLVGPGPPGQDTEPRDPELERQYLDQDFPEGFENGKFNLIF